MAWDTALVDQVFADHDAEGPGCALGVVQDGVLVYTAGYGCASLEHPVPITPDTVFDIGSTSKQFTAAAALTLADEHASRSTTRSAATCRRFRRTRSGR